MKIKIYLAPMAGITDIAMRELCIKEGAQMSYTEMVSAKGIAYDNIKTNELLKLSPLEKQIGIQIFGNDASIMSDTAAKLQDKLKDRLYVLDINMGCPVLKVTRNEEGCALMRTPKLAAKIIKKVKKAISVPVSVKFRKGWDDESVNAVEFSKIAEDAGADILTVHGRTRNQFYNGTADWDIIGEVKNAVGVKVIGNGDIFEANDAQKMLQVTGCDGVMVARGARGNPFLFRQIRELLYDGKVRTMPTDIEKLRMCIQQARLATKYKGERMAMLQMRTHASHYTKKMKNSAYLRNSLVQVKSLVELEDLLYNYIEKVLAI